MPRVKLLYKTDTKIMSIIYTTYNVATTYTSISKSLATVIIDDNWSAIVSERSRKRRMFTTAHLIEDRKRLH